MIWVGAEHIGIGGAGVEVEARSASCLVESGAVETGCSTVAAAVLNGSDNLRHHPEALEPGHGESTLKRCTGDQKRPLSLRLCVGVWRVPGDPNLTLREKSEKKAAQIALLGLKYVKRPRDRSIILNNLAYGYIKMGHCDFALSLLKNALKLQPNYRDALTNRNYCLQQMRNQQRRGVRR